jgi:hypothetical protein
VPARILLIRAGSGVYSFLRAWKTRTPKLNDLIRYNYRSVTFVPVAEHPYAVGGSTSTAHPLTEPRTGDLINAVSALGRRSEYRVTRGHPNHGDRDGDRRAAAGHDRGHLLRDKTVR